MPATRFVNAEPRISATDAARSRVEPRPKRRGITTLLVSGTILAVLAAGCNRTDGAGNQPVTPSNNDKGTSVYTGKDDYGTALAKCLNEETSKNPPKKTTTPTPAPGTDPKILKFCQDLLLNQPHS